MTQFFARTLVMVVVSGGFLGSLTACGGKAKATGVVEKESTPDDPVPAPVAPAPTWEEQVDGMMGSFDQVGYRLTHAGELVADLMANAPVVSSFGTFTPAQTLNPLVFGDLGFLVYGNDGVFAAECELSESNADFGRNHPLCQVFGAENYDRMIVCFANQEGADVMQAQAWPGSPTAFEEGRGMICYVDGIRMLSSHVFTY